MALQGGAATTATGLTLHLPPRPHISSFPSSLSPSPPGKPRSWPDAFPGLSSPTSTSASASFRTRAVVGEGLTRWTSFYDLLGISEEGTFDDIKRAYKQKARMYHPDVCPPDQTEEYTRRFIEVHEAYETLSDPWTRALYDRDLARGLHRAFSASRSSDDGLDVKSAWKSRWEDQVVELKKRSAHKDSGNLSWGARMRSQRAQTTTAS